MGLFDRFKNPADEAEVQLIQKRIMEICDSGDDSYSLEKAKKLAILSASFYLALSNDYCGDTNCTVTTNASYSERTDRTSTRGTITMYNPNSGYHLENLFDHMEMN